jgi:hypothetical protein
MVNEVKGIADLIRFINAEFECAYEQVVMFIAVKLKNDEGRFDKERLIDFFMDLFDYVQKEGGVMDESCDPLQGGDRKKVLSMLNRVPISTLLRSGVFKTFERFNFDLFKEIFNNEEAVVVALKNRLKGYFSRKGLNQKKAEAILAEWEADMDEVIKTDALMKITERPDKFTLEFLLKFLYQSYSLGSFENLMRDHHINQKELIDYFSSKLNFPVARIGEPAPLAAIISEKPAEARVPAPAPVTAPVEEHIKSLTEFFHKMREEALEEEEAQKKKKGK